MKAFVAVSLFFIGCGPLHGGARDTGAVDPTLTYDQFRSLPYESELLIAALEPDRQIDAFLDMLDETEPPDLGLAWKIARTGDPLVDAAQVRLVHDKDEVHQSDLLLLLWVIHREGYADVRGRVRLMALLEELVHEMKGDQLQRASAETLHSIRSLPPAAHRGGQ